MAMCSLLAEAMVAEQLSYEPETGSFTTVGPMTTARRVMHTATLLPDGTVLIAGGVTGINGSTYTAEIYDPATRSFFPTGDLAEERLGQTATLLPNRSVLLLGGSKALTLNAVSHAEIYH
jgi:hypothetical protein